MTDADAKWLIVGLGNPGKEYAETRHNVGFMAIEALGRKHGIVGKQQNKQRAMIGTGSINQHAVILAEPLTYMNLSGESVRAIMDYYRVPIEHLIVIYDEAALPFGKIRVRPGGSAAGHNGIKSLIQHLNGDQNFARIRIGIGMPEHTGQMKDFVLNRFLDTEKVHLTEILTWTIEATEALLVGDMSQVMSRFNALALPVES